MSSKTRLDTYLSSHGYFDSREKARKVIMAGSVFLNGQRIDKPGFMIDPQNTDLNIEIKDEVLPYVSRGGFKLEKALKEFHIQVKGKTVLDVGASTGGFTDCLLQAGATKVFAVDVGYGQLDWKLRQDPRVVVMERTNARYLTVEQLGQYCDLATIDVSFISLKLIFPAIKECLTESGEIAALIKPKFEAGREKVGKKGVVRDPQTHENVLSEIVYFAVKQGLYMKNLSYSPITGPEGNIEFLIHLSKIPEGMMMENLTEYIHRLVEEAHRMLIR